jgi:hypothetical protein
MIKISEIEKQAIVMMAFKNELEKNAQFNAILGGLAKKVFPKLLSLGAKGTRFGGTRVGTALRHSAGVYKQKGGRAAVKYLSKFKAPGHLRSFTKGSPIENIKAHRYTKKMTTGNKPDFGAGVLKSIGNFADTATHLGTGLKGQGVFKGTWQATKNITNLAGKQLQSARFKTVDLGAKNIAGNTVKGEGMFKNKFFDRKLVGKTNTGLGFVKKRAPMQAAAMAFTAPGFAAQAYMTKKTDKGEPISQARRLAGAAKEGVL